MTRAKNDNPPEVFQQNTSTPDAGAKQAPGKSNEPDAVLRTGSLPPSSAVKIAVEDKGAARKAMRQQIGCNDKNKAGEVTGNGYRGN